ncbi:MAG: DNA topoisomerase I [bacterium]|nr:DNA topoisomerase I [bacterium]
MVELIITEKPKAAQKIAAALAEGKPIKETNKGVSFYKITRGKKDILVGCAVGHLYGLVEKEKKGWKYPVFDVEWKPIHETNKSAAFSKKYLTALKKLSKEADEFTLATDYDIEGETIGLNILRYACKQKDAKRMKFSTLTKPDVIKAYEDVSPTLDWGQAKAGETRHEMDWYWGINLSRALTSSIKSAGMFKILSIGRVQGPALKIIVDKEKDIKAFKPDPFWQIELNGKTKEGTIDAWHEKDKFWEKKEADAVLKKVKGKDGVASDVKLGEIKQSPPVPFDLTTLQTEAYRSLRVAPKRTLEIAQELYTSGFISYPRTSSQQLPPAIGYKKILEQLSKQKNYKELCEKLMKKDLKPNNGKKTDPAHPAIYPTGISPKNLEEKSEKVYDLVVRRFMATFAEPALRETMTVKIDVNKEIFVSKGIRTKEKGWHVFYGPHVNLKEEEFPKITKGEDVKVKKIKLHAKETQPPPRYTPASIIRELEKKNLGTKATRSEIIDTLYKRGYVDGRSVEATNLGIHMVETLEKNCSKVLDEELTRHFEMEMEEIQEKKKEGKDVLKEARTVLKGILTDFKKKEKDIGDGLFEATKESHEKANTIGPCPNCKEGTLMMRKGKFGRFIACNKYPDCKTTFNIPNTGLAKPSEDLCEECKHPLILMIRKNKKPQSVCINADCPSKTLETDKENTPCPRCGTGKLVIRKSVYGHFLACGAFPKCMYIDRSKKKEEEPIIKKSK